MEDIVESFQNMNIQKNNDLIVYIKQLNIPQNIKHTLMHLIENDNYDSYIDIYNICIENDIELPPI